MLFLLHKLLDMSAERRLRRLSHVAIAKDAKVRYRAIGGQPFGEVRIGSGSIIEGYVTADRAGACVRIGDNTFIGGGTKLVSAVRIDIGNDVMISWNCTIVDHDSHSLRWSERRQDVRDWYVGQKDWTHVAMRPVRIGNRCWLGFDVAVLKGVTIGDGSVVAARSVVTRDVPPDVLVAGNPARIIRSLEDHE